MMFRPLGLRYGKGATRVESDLTSVVPGAKKIPEVNPMNQSEGTRLENIRQAPRCGATTRAKTPCRCPAIRGRQRCRLHGGHSPGAPRGINNGNYKDGDWTADAIAERRWLRDLVNEFAGGETK